MHNASSSTSKFRSGRPSSKSSSAAGSESVNDSWHAAKTDTVHPLESLADSEPAADDDLLDGLPDRNLDMELEALCNHMTPMEAQRLRRYVDIYMDDFCCLCQGGPTFRADARRHVFHTIDRVFRPNNHLDENRQEPNSMKKLGKGDAAWITRKRMLGWIIDTVRMTLSLPA